jgi:excisionase family DNA binding protein
MVPTDPSPPLALRPREAARALGVSARTLWTWTRDGHVPHVRVGNGKRKTTLYPVAELRDWLARNAASRPEGGANP